MDYLIFARKYRPQTFSEIVGQEAIATTLTNAIKQNRVPQSFLFSGPRGVGKTSMARILAKALNCENGPTENPCGKCQSCKEITGGNSLDILEIDGASNNSVENIRELRETVKFKPTSGRCKIYIIDEVHMLSTGAFNALLKTLEEPPPHVKFIFATTEAHKVPITILSRCQRFHFKRIPIPVITKKLEEIAKKEKLKYEKNVPFLIAKASEGALRDGESLLDQLGSFSEGKIKEEDVLAILGTASDEIYLSILEALKNKEGAQIFSLIKKFYEEGGEFAQFGKGLLEVFRHLLILKSVKKGEVFIEASTDMIRELNKIKDSFLEGELLLALSVLQNLQMQLRRPLAPPKILVETALLKLIYIDGFQPTENLIKETHFAERTVNLGDKSGEKKILKPTDSRIEETVLTEKKSQLYSKRGDSSPKSSGEDLTLNKTEALWPQVIEYVKKRRMSTSIFLSESEPVEANGTVVTLGMPTEFKFHKETLEKETNRKMVEEAFKAVFKQKIKIQFVITEKESASHELPQSEKADSEGDLPEIISQALEVFDGAKIIRKE